MTQTETKFEKIIIEKPAGTVIGKLSWVGQLCKGRVVKYTWTESPVCDDLIILRQPEVVTA